VNRHEQIAAELRRLIDQAVLRPGERLPSVRQASQAHRTSVATVQRAYEQLETEGLVQARTRSGWYVRSLGLTHSQSERARQMRAYEHGNEVHDLWLDVREDAHRPELVALGSENPGASLYPWAEEARAAAKAGRHFSERMGLSGRPPGNADLRRLISLHYLQLGTEVSPEEILITSGAQESLSLALAAVTGRGDCVIIEAPTCPQILQALRATERRCFAVPVLDEGEVDLDAIEDALASNRIGACLMMTSCRDPVGTTMSEAEKKRLVELLARHGVPLVEEDSDGELWFSRRPPRPAKAFDALGQVLHAGTFAKTLSPACGVAWIAAGRYRLKLEQLKMSSGGLTGALNQAAVVEYLIGGGYGPHLRRLRRGLSGQSALMVEALRRALPREARIFAPAGGCVLWVRLPEAIDGIELRRRARNLGVGLAPGAMFSRRPGYGNFIRVGFGERWSERQDGAVKILGNLVTDYARPSVPQ
jgi:DNA-binding transcriptional MocR family regulator